MRIGVEFRGIRHRVSTIKKGKQALKRSLRSCTLEAEGCHRERVTTFLASFLPSAALHHHDPHHHHHHNHHHHHHHHHHRHRRRILLLLCTRLYFIESQTHRLASTIVCAAITIFMKY